MKSCGVETIFYKVLQKPGMPIFAGKLGNKLIFALPGNPASVLVCFYEYVYSAIKQMQGFQNIHLPKVKLKTINPIAKKGGKSSFIRAKILNDRVLELEKQDSNMLRSFAEADGFIYLNKEIETVKQNEEVEVHLLPFMK
jgi:molybdopterin molybdotransferase